MGRGFPREHAFTQQFPCQSVFGGTDSVSTPPPSLTGQASPKEHSFTQQLLRETERDTERQRKLNCVSLPAADVIIFKKDQRETERHKGAPFPQPFFPHSRLVLVTLYGGEGFLLASIVKFFLGRGVLEEGGFLTLIYWPLLLTL